MPRHPALGWPNWRTSPWHGDAGSPPRPPPPRGGTRRGARKNKKLLASGGGGGRRRGQFWPRRPRACTHTARRPGLPPELKRATRHTHALTHSLTENAHPYPHSQTRPSAAAPRARSSSVVVAGAWFVHAERVVVGGRGEWMRPCTRHPRAPSPRSCTLPCPRAGRAGARAPSPLANGERAAGGACGGGGATLSWPRRGGAPAHALGVLAPLGGCQGSAGHVCAGLRGVQAVPLAGNGVAGGAAAAGAGQGSDPPRPPRPLGPPPLSVARPRRCPTAAAPALAAPHHACRSYHTRPH